MLKIMDWILQTCGSSLQKAMKSSRFSILLKKEDEIDAVNPDTDQGVAYRAGHLVMGTLLARLPEKLAIEQVRNNPVKIQPSLEERALIRYCGEKIISTAKRCLPQRVRKLAKSWSVSSAEEQLNIVRDLYFEFRTESQEAKGELSMNLVNEKFVRGQERRAHDELSYLPGLYKAWDKQNSPANCQGKTQMLLAFAKLAGAEALVIHPIEHAKDYITQKRRELKQAVEDDIIARGLESGCHMFTDGLLAGQIDDRMRDKDGECFHVGVALKLKDERWVMLDSHGLSWGLIPDEWGMAPTVTMLEKYRDVLPGLTVIAGNRNINKALVDGLVTKAHDILDRSKRMGERIRAEVRSISDLIDVICGSDDFDVIMKINAEQEGQIHRSFSHPELRKYAVMMIVMGGEDVLFDFSKMIDPNFLEKRIKVWLTFYHACAMNLFLNRETDQGLIIHPVCEVSASAEWSVAISAINSARFDRPGLCTEGHSFFVRNSFDQTSLHNAVGFFNGAIGVAAQKALQSLPYKHPMCERKLQMMERRQYAW
jgi:hypothetical protein